MVKLQIKLNANKARLSSLMLSSIGLFALASEASAADAVNAPVGYVLANDMTDVASVSLNADGSLLVSMADGSEAILPPGTFTLSNGEVYVEASVANDLSPYMVSDSGNSVFMVGGAFAAVGAIVALVSIEEGPDNVAPVFSSGTTGSFAENATGTAYSASASDGNGDAISYTLSGTDAALFNIDAASGAVTFRSTPDFEAPADAGGDNVYNITVSASDGVLSTSQSVVITVTNENDNAPILTSATTATVSENETDIGYTATATDADGDTLTYTITGGADAALFVIDSATGALAFAAGQDFEAPADGNADNQYEVVVQVSDLTLTDDQTVTVTVTNANDSAPVFTSGATASLAENTTATGYVAVTTDVDGGAATYTITGGADASLFAADATTGALSFIAAPDFDTPSDANADNVFDVIVTANDGANTTAQTIAVKLTNINDNSPVFTSSAVISFDENGTASLFSVAATDGDGDTLTYSISGGADAAQFTIDSATGAVSFVNSPDFEAPTDAGANNTYNIIVRADDGTFQSNQAVAISINNLNDNAPVITGGAASVAENSVTTGFTATATDADGNAVTFSISGGADAALFAIDATTGALSFIVAPDFDQPGDVGADNVYDVDVEASDGVATDTASVAITVTNLNDEIPVFTSGGTASVDENLTVTGYSGAATDGDGDTLSFSISGGVDSALFTIDSATGALSFIAAPDFENPGDTGADNTYDVDVTVSDGVNTATQSVTISVTDVVAEAPIFSSGATGSISENSTATAYTALAVDPNGNPVTYSISGGADAAQFTINASTGDVQLIAAADFEAPGDAGADNVYDIEISAFDGTDTATQNVAISVTNQNDVAPTFTSSGTVSSAENSTAAFYTPVVADPDGTSLTYTIVGGPDASFFTIDASTGAVSFTIAPDFETRIDADTNNEYLFTIEVSDGIQSTQQQVRATVTDADDAPQFDVSGAVSIAENQTVTSYVVPASDQDGDVITYSITGGADAAAFTINAATGQLEFVTAPNFEAPADAGADNVYDVTVTASSSTLSTDQAVAVTVTNVNEAPTITSGASAAVDENSTAANYTVAATDVDGDTLSYSIVGGADAALFTIDAATGVVSFITSPNFEAPTDAGANNVYDIVVGVDDGPLLTTQAVSITINNLNDTVPVVTGGTISVAENTVATGFTATATDADGNAVTFSIAGGADAALFAIDATTGALSFIAAPDFEAPGDAGADNIYDVNVQASDGTFTDTAAVAVTVTNVNDLTPVFTSGATVAVDENLTTTGYTAVATDGDGDTLSYSISGGTDAALFTVDSATGALSFIAGPDFENPTDTGADNVYDVVLTASDGVNSSNQAVAVTVQDVAVEGPVFSSPSTANFAENAVGVAYSAAAATPGSAVPSTFSITGGADASLFVINAVTGDISFLASPDFESPTDTGTDNGYEIEITASDGTFSTAQLVTIGVTDVNDVAPTFTSAGTATIDENSTAVIYTPTVTDPDGATPTYSIVGGADAALFTIDSATGALSLISGVNFENPTDTNTDGAYNVDIEANDGVQASTQAVAVTVNDINEAPTFNAAFPTTIVENTTGTFFTVGAADPEGSAVTYTLSGTAAFFFNIDSATGELTTSGQFPIDFEGNIVSNNIITGAITASDGTLSTTQTLAFQITDVNEVPTAIPSGFQGAFTFARSGAEGDSSVMFQAPGFVQQTSDLDVTWVDPENAALTFTLSGTDAAAFTIDAGNNVVINTLLDFENPTDANTNNIYEFDLTVSDGVNTFTQAYTYTVRNIPDIDVIMTSGATASTYENLVYTPAYIATAVDGDGLITPTFTITGGADASLFTIDSATGYVTFVNPPDFEAPGDSDTNNVYEVEVTASDNTSTDSQLVSITVQDVTGLQFVSAPNVSFDEGRFFDSRLPETYLEAVNDTGAAITYSIGTGPDAGIVSIGGSSLLPPNSALARLNQANDFENPSDANGDNIFEFTIVANDGTSTATQNYTITSLDLDDTAPVVTSTAAVSVAENLTLAYTLTATDVDTDDSTLTYFIQGAGADNALFTIDQNTGELSFITPPDFENPSDANNDNVYDVTLLASDGTQGVLHSVSITVTDVVNANVTNDLSTLSDISDDDMLLDWTQVEDTPGLIMDEGRQWLLDAVMDLNPALFEDRSEPDLSDIESFVPIFPSIIDRVLTVEDFGPTDVGHVPMDMSLLEDEAMTPMISFFQTYDVA